MGDSDREIVVGDRVRFNERGRQCNPRTRNVEATVVGITPTRGDLKLLRDNGRSPQVWPKRLWELIPEDEEQHDDR